MSEGKLSKEPRCSCGNGSVPGPAHHPTCTAYVHFPVPGEQPSSKNDLAARLRIELCGKGLTDEYELVLEAADELERLTRELADVQRMRNAELYRQPDETTAVHKDPTGTTREPPHCPSCSCGLPRDFTGRPIEPRGL